MRHVKSPIVTFFMEKNFHYYNVSADMHIRSVDKHCAIPGFSSLKSIYNHD